MRDAFHVLSTYQDLLLHSQIDPRDNMANEQLPSDPIVQKPSSMKSAQSSSPGKTPSNKLRGTSWRVTVSLGAVVALAVCGANIGALAYIQSTFGSEEGVATVFVGSCDKTKTVTLWADLAVNILSTLLLGASNNAAQLLSAPSRKDVDAAHAKRKWLEIGVPSVRNLLNVSGWRVTLWTLLFLSSVPLHLL